MQTLSDALPLYKILARSIGLSEATITWSENALRYFRQFPGWDVPLEKLKAQDLRNFILAIRQKKAYAGHPCSKAKERLLSDQSVNGYTRAIKQIFSLLVRGEILKENPFEGIKSPKIKKRVIPSLSEGNLRRLLQLPIKTNIPINQLKPRSVIIVSE